MGINVDDEHYFSSRFNEEWFWVLGYGTTAVLVIVANTLMLRSITKNAFLHTNTHRSFALLATRNILRAMYGLSVVYTSRWTHPHGKTNQDTIQVHSSKVKLPLVCDIMCTMDIFFLALPMFIMVGLSIHMFTRAPSPHFNPFPVDDDYIGHNGLKSFLKDHSKFLLTVRHRYDVSSPESTLEFIMKIEEISNKKQDYRKKYSHLERI